MLILSMVPIFLLSENNYFSKVIFHIAFQIPYLKHFSTQTVMLGILSSFHIRLFLERPLRIVQSVFFTIVVFEEKKEGYGSTVNRSHFIRLMIELEDGTFWIQLPLYSLRNFYRRVVRSKVLFATLVFAVKAFTGQDEESIGIDLNTCLFTFQCLQKGSGGDQSELAGQSYYSSQIAHKDKEHIGNAAKY